MNRRQQQVIDYLRTENQVLKETFGQRRILLSDDQRRRLAAKGKILGRKLLAEIGTLFTPLTRHGGRSCCLHGPPEQFWRLLRANPVLRGV